MIKYLAVLAHVFGLFALGVTMDDGVIIEDNTPGTLAQGDSREVMITVNKGDVSGFAKLQLELPDGLEAVAGDTKGASFTFSGQKVKFIWMTLPDEQEFTVSYTLKAKAVASGKKVITGTFSYIKNNQRVDYELQSKMVEIVSADEVSDATQPSFDGLDIDGMACVRTITDMGDNRYLVRLDVVNAELEGFCKIKDNLPGGFTASEENADGSVVTIDGNSVKFVWFDAPATTSFNVSYLLEGSGDPLSITGSLSYVENNAPQEIPVLGSGAIQQAALAEVKEEVDELSEVTEDLDKEAPEEVENEEAQEVTEVIAESEEQAEEVTEVIEEVAEETTTAEGNGTSVPDPETGVTYKVQIAAAHRVVGEEYFRKRHGFDEGFGIENHKGWVKYTTGSYPIYKAARDDRERIRNRYDFRGPFVTAYNEGDRITVQEALMITKQQWYK